MSRAREASKAAVCLSNLHQIAIAATTYSVDNKGAILPATVISGGKVTDTINGQTGTYYVNFAFEYLTSNAAYEFKRGLLGRYLKTEKALICPTVEGYGLAMPPYYAKGQIPVDYFPCMTAGTYTKMARLDRSDETAMFADGIGLNYATVGLIRGESTGNYSQAYPPSYGLQLGDAIHGRHPNSTCNVAWADGHASVIPVQVEPDACMYSTFTPAMNILRRANHIGTIYPSKIDFTQYSSYSTWATDCISTYNYYFWGNKKRKVLGT